jgi:tRNA threonylcarbamoyladenosine biosynthesis protein TsaB
VVILAVHSTSASLSVAITKKRVVLREVILPPDRKHLEMLAPLIRDVTAELHLSVMDIDGFGVAMGPGTFSGTRVGLATIKGMALALAKPVAGISSLDILAWQALKDGEWGAPVIDARRGEIYTAFYRKSEEKVMLVAGPMLIKVEEFSQNARKVSDKLILCGDPVLDHLVESIPNLVRSPVAAPSAAACSLLAYERIRQGNADDLHLLTPLYIRRSDAEENKRLN